MILLTFYGLCRDHEDHWLDQLGPVNAASFDLRQFSVGDLETADGDFYFDETTQ